MKNKLKNFKNKFSLFLSFLFLFQLILFNSNNTAFAVTTPSISYTVTGETKIGNTIEIAVNISNVTDLYGGSIDFIYDTSLLEIQSVTKGNIFGSNTVLTPLGSNGKVENGQASFALFLNGDKSGVNGSGTLAVIKAKVLKEGTVKLNTTNSNKPGLSLDGNTVRVKLSNSKIGNIDYMYKNKSITLNNNTKKLDAQIVSENIPTSMEAGKVYPVTIQVKNIGSTTWTASTNFKLGINPYNNAFTNTARQFLSSSDAISPGQTVTFKFNLTAPSSPSSYDFSIQMLQEGIAWFGQSISKKITVFNK